MNEERARIDPDNHYPAEGLRVVERLALQVLEHLPAAHLERTRDAIQLAHGGDAGIVVLVTAESVELRLPTVEWTGGAYGPAPASRLWKRVRAASLLDDASPLAELLERAHEARLRQFKTCRYCKKLVPQEYRHGTTCHSCAERFEGIVH